MLDNIEANLVDANDYMEKAEVHLQKAKKWHEKARSVSYSNIIIVENVLYYDMYASCDVYFAIWSFQSPRLKKSVINQSKYEKLNS